MISRELIIEYLKVFSINKDYVHAMWLEGSDGIGKVDEYSDIDFWFDVDKEKTESFLLECIEHLSKLDNIDSRVDEFRNDIKQSNIHLKSTSEYLTLDICVQSHEVRGLSCTCFTRNDIAELPLVIFDKKNIITYKDEVIDLENIKNLYLNNRYRISQSSRVIKYINRNQYLECYMKYLEDIANPLVKIVRLIYTPNHCDYVLCHISNHLPKEVVNELEILYKVNSFEDIKNNIEYANRLLDKYSKILIEKYDIGDIYDKKNR